MKSHVFIAAAAAGLLMAAPAQAGDAAAGAKVFKKCKACHYVDREKNKSGPHLVNIIGRAAGAVDGFKYSKAMAGSGLVWDEATLAGFLAKPKKYLKGTKMSFAGLKKESDISNVIASLKSPKSLDALAGEGVSFGLLRAMALLGSFFTANKSWI